MIIFHLCLFILICIYKFIYCSHFSFEKKPFICTVLNAKNYTMKNRINENKLSLNKMKISKITNLKVIKGGDDPKNGTCLFPENASKPKDTIIHP